MIDFLNEALSNIKVHHCNLYPIYVDDGVVEKHYLEFSLNLVNTIEDYYLSKFNFCLDAKSDYSYNLYFRQNTKLPIILELDYNKFLFYIEFKSLKNNRTILIGVEKDNSHLHVNLYSNFNLPKVKKRGEFFLISNFVNDGISVHLLSIFYEFMENDIFNQEDPFHNLLIN